MRVEENVELVSSDGAAAVEDLYGLAVVVTGHNHFSAERVLFVSGDEGIALPDFVTTGRYPICELAAAFFTGAISSDTHPDRLPLAGWFVPDLCFRWIQGGWTNDVCLSSGAEQRELAVGLCQHRSDDPADYRGDYRK